MRANPSEESERPKAMGAMLRLLREFGAQDWLVLVYFVVLLSCAHLADPDPRKARSVLGLGALCLMFLGGVTLVRLRLLTGTTSTALVYRIAVYGSVQSSYFLLRDLLPIINPTRSFDTEFRQIDLALFGFEPALSLDSWVNPAATEWFAFFYFSYFCLLAFHIFPVLALAKNQMLLGEFCFSMLWLFCAGHIIYILAPGYGPIVALSGEFTTELPRGLWYDMVMSTVTSAGAQMDIFPSLHTAAPVFFTLFSFRYRARLPFRYTWPVLAFFSVNIIVATMYLRWHWVIDIVAGIFHAAIALMLAQVLTARELRRRLAQGLTANWPRFGTALSSRNSRPSQHPEKLEAA